MCVCVHMFLQASVYLIPEELFKMELEEGMDRVQKAIQVFWTFKRSFQQHRDKLTPTGPYGRPGLAVKPWDFPSELVFHRTDCIMERLRMIEVCSHTSIPYEKKLSIYSSDLDGCRKKILKSSNVCQKNMHDKIVKIKHFYVLLHTEFVILYCDDLLL